MYNGAKKEVKKAVLNTTNNIMELTAVIEALSLLKEPCKVSLFSDSAYVVNAINKGWLSKWQKSNWIASTKEPVKNKELWLQLITLINRHVVAFNKVKGHSDNEYNNRCDLLANEAMDEFKGGKHGA